MDIRQKYQKWRAGETSLPAHLALTWARAAEPPALPWEDLGSKRRAELTRDGFDVTIVLDIDGDADASWLDADAYPIKQRRADLSKLGYSRAVAEETARSEAARDARKLRGLRSGDWCMFLITVDVYRAGVRLAGDALGSCDLGESYGPEFEREASQTVADHGMIEHSIEAARDVLAVLCNGRPWIPSVIDGGTE